MTKFLLCLFGFGRLPDVCWFSRNFFDVHDYPESKGGDGIPSHFHTYTCSCCGKEFMI